MMDKNVFLPFKVGQLAESRSFLAGFRSAWFRCKIKEISWKKGQIGHALEFFDFPDEKINWTKLYQKPSIAGSKSNEKKTQLMVRPSFPRIYKECELPDVNEISEVTAVVNDVWKVGDLVDWWTDGCFWSGRITQVLSAEETVKIQLPPPPLGEGLCYDGFCKDLRPSLDWSLEVGWTVPTPTEPENSCPCAQIIKPVNPVAKAVPNLIINAVDEGRKDVQDKAGSSVEMNAAFSSQTDSILHAVDEGGGKDVKDTAGSSVEMNTSLSSETSSRTSPFPDRSELFLCKELPRQPSSVTSSEEGMHVPETKIDLNVANSSIGSGSLLDNASGSLVRDALDGTAITGKDDDDQCCKSGPSKKMRTGESISLNSVRSNTLEASISDLEELANKVKWLRGILEFGNTEAIRPPWKFLEQRPSAPQK